MPDKWPPFLDKEYLTAVRRGVDFKPPIIPKKTEVNTISDLKIPGIKLLNEVVLAFINY